MALDFDVIIDANAAHAPFGEDVRLARQWLDRGPVEFFEQLTASAAEPADYSLIVEPLKQLADRGV